MSVTHGTTGRFAWAAYATTALALFLSLAARADDRIVFGTNWLPQCEHGGFYEARETGLYAKNGLDVVIRPGGPQVNTSQLLAGGAIDIGLMGGSSQILAFVDQKAPFLAVAAFFQKDPAVLVTHAGVGNDSLEALKGKPIMIATDSWVGFWPFLKQKYGYTDDQIRAYSFSPQPFLADPKAIMQGYATNDPYTLKEAGVAANLFLLADYGFSSYSHIIATSERLVAQKPDVLRRFIAASAAGWKAYLYGDPSPADQAIVRENPDYTLEHAAACRELIKADHLVDSGDALTLGYGAMTEARWKASAETLISAGLLPADIDWHKAYTTRFINTGPN